MTGELGLIAIAGLLGSSHCLGMCGGFAMLVSLSAAGRRRAWLHQLAYSTGRVFTYSFLGMLAGLVGSRVMLGVSLPGAINAAAVFSVLCGLFLIVQGLGAAGLRWRRTQAVVSQGPCLSGMVLGSFLRGGGSLHAFLGGVLTGFLPCGLVYGFLALAAAQGTPWQGMGVMAAFGLGTVPLMVLAGQGSRWLGLQARQRLLRLAAVCVIVTGAVTVVRGASFLRTDPRTPGACPFCISEKGGAR